MKIAFATFVSLIALTVIAGLALLTADWNRAKPWLNARASEALGRRFFIAGDLSLSWETLGADPAGPDGGWRRLIPWPHLVAQDIHIGNPPSMLLATDANAPPLPADMASIRQLAFSLNPLALLGKNISIPALRFDSPGIDLRRDAQGRNNWTFRHDDSPSTWHLTVQQVIFSKGSVHLLDLVRHIDANAQIDTRPQDHGYGVAWQLQGRFNQETISANGLAGAVLSLQHQTLPYPVKANLRVGKTDIAIEGTLTRPTDLAALDMHLKVSATSMGRLFALSGIYLPETPPFATQGHLVGTLGPTGSHWIYRDFTGKVGSSDVGGTLEYQTGQPRPRLSGTIVAHLLQFSDLAPLIGADSSASKAERGATVMQPAGKVLPVEPFRTERWTSLDADVRFSAEKIIRNKALPIQKLSTTIRLRDGVLSLQPLDFDVAGGSLSSTIILDASTQVGKDAIKATMSITARHLKLKQLFPEAQMLQASAGEINGDASLSAVGNSIASLLGGANGEVKTLINQGTVSKLLLEEMGLNVGNVLVSRLFGDKQVKLNCMATDFEVTSGLMQSRSFIIDTDDAVLVVTGNIDLAREQLDLTIYPNSKGLRILSFRAPLYVRGSLRHPDVSVDKGILAMRAGGAVALAILTPAAAILPLINAGPGERSECARLLADARVRPVAPPPGKRPHRHRSNLK